MESDIVIAICAAASVWLGAVLSLSGLIMSKEQKVSEFRQNWIDSLRTEISLLIAAVNTIGWFDETAKQNKVIKKSNVMEHMDRLQEAHRRVSEAYTSILLRVNPRDKDKKLSKRNRKFLAELHVLMRGLTRENYDPASLDVNVVRKAARPMLKMEWERVKKGELKYRITIWMSAFLLLVSGTALGTLIYRYFQM